MNHSVAHKETAEPQKIDGQNAAVVEKKSEELEDSKFDLGGYENPYQYLKPKLPRNSSVLTFSPSSFAGICC